MTDDSLGLPDDANAEEVFHRYADRLVEFAKRYLDVELTGKIDPEDVMQSTLRSFIRRQEEGAYELTSWESLWYLLAQITRRKCFRAERFHSANKRDIHREQRIDSVDRESEIGRWQIDQRQPRIEDVFALRDTVSWLMLSLEPPQREIVILHLQGFKTAEIADSVSRTQRTVRRTLRLVRDAIYAHHSELRHINNSKSE